MSDTPAHEAFALVEDILESNRDFWLNKSHCQGEMRECGIPNEADAPNVDMGQLRRLHELLEKATNAPSERAPRSGETMLERAYCKANDYINALLTPSVDPKSLLKIRSDYLAAVRDVMTCAGCKDSQEGCPTPQECAMVRRAREAPSAKTRSCSCGATPGEYHRTGCGYEGVFT